MTPASMSFRTHSRVCTLLIVDERIGSPSKKLGTNGARAKLRMAGFREAFERPLLGRKRSYQVNELVRSRLSKALLGAFRVPRPESPARRPALLRPRP